MMKTFQQFIKAICFGKIDFSLAFRERNFPFLWLISASFFKHSQQNVCRQVIVLGSVKVSRQIEQVTCSLRVFSRDSIVKSCFTVTKCTFLKFRFRCDSGILDLYIGLEKNSFIYPWLSNRIFRVYPLMERKCLLWFSKAHFLSLESTDERKSKERKKSYYIMERSLKLEKVESFFRIPNMFLS